MTALSVDPKPPGPSGFAPGIPAHQQGSLDGLCGVYSIINALTLLLGDKAFDPKSLFIDLLRAIPGSLITISVEGMHKHQFAKLIRTASMHLAKRKIGLDYRCAFSRQPDSLGEFWHVLAEHHENAGEGSTLIGITGLYDHWTCVRSVEADRLVLADSGDLDEIERHRATIGRPTTKRPICIQPMQAFLLWETEWKNIDPGATRSVSTPQAKDASAEARATP